MDDCVLTDVPVRVLDVLLVEDESLIAMLLEDMLTELGHRVVGPLCDLKKALEAATTAAVDIAILDININGGDTFPIAEVLASRNIPFIFSTGYNKSSLPTRYQHGLVLQKPFHRQDLRQVLLDAFPEATL